MTQIILHQYAMSPFSQKVRKILALKGMEYAQVEQPAWMPKPQLTPLTAGYRRIPVMQIGADIYCDTWLIVRKLEELQPVPSIFPSSGPAAADAIDQWADRVLFLKMVPLVFTAMSDAIPAELFQDRQKMAPQLSLETLQVAAPSCRSAVESALARIELTFAGAPYLLGDRITVADIAVYHALWFGRSAPEIAEAIQSKPAVADWFARIDALGEGEVTHLEPDAALKIARDAEPLDGNDSEKPPGGPPLGALVEVASDDLPTDRFRGRVLHTGIDEFAIEHENDIVGRVSIHFPRAACSFRVLE